MPQDGQPTCTLPTPKKLRWVLRRCEVSNSKCDGRGYEISSGAKPKDVVADDTEGLGAALVGGRGERFEILAGLSTECSVPYIERSQIHT